jgi:hypothetical protein
MRTTGLCSALLTLTLLSSCDPEDAAGSDGGASDAAPPMDSGTTPGAEGPDANGPDPASDGGAGPSADAGPDVRCVAPSGAGTTHVGTIDADETWTAADSPHVVTGDIHVVGATLTIEPCAVVRLRKGLIIDVRGDGELNAHGEYVGATRRPIVFERDDAADPWGALRVFGDGMLDLEHVDLSGGGDHDTAPSGGGTLIAEGNGGNSGLTENLRVVDVVIEGSEGFGVNLRARAAFTDNSDSLVIRGAGSVPSPTNLDTSYPIYASGPAFSTIPSGSLTGNARDEIFVADAATLYDLSVRFHERGVPYRFESSFGMQPMASAAEGGLSTLTIDAGVVIRFGTSDTWSMNLGASSGTAATDQWPVRVIANGTPEGPIVLTTASDNPAPGSWAGVEWFSGPSSGNVMNNVHIEFAGADSGNSNFGCGPNESNAALFIGNWVPADPFVADCTFSDSASGGIVCGWDANATTIAGVLAIQNTFERIGNDCRVSQNQAANGSCPTPGPTCLP